MKNKKTIISILVYIGLLAVVVVSFVLITNFQKNSSYETILMSAKAFPRNEQIQMTDNTYNSYVVSEKVPSDTILKMKENGSTPVTTKADIQGKYSIGYIPEGIILTTEMFDNKVISADGISNTQNDYDSASYVVLKANKINAPVNGYKKGTKISIQNVEAIVNTHADGTEEKNYGTLVNKAEIYNVFYDENEAVTHIGILCEAEDVKKLITLEDLGTTFRYIEGVLPLTTWTENDIINEYNIKNMNNDELLYRHTSSIPENITTLFNSSELIKNSSYTDDNFGNVPEITTQQNVLIGLRGLYEPSQIVMAKYGLDGGIQENIRSFIQDEKYNISYIILENNSNTTNEGYYEIKVQTLTEVKQYHFIIENKDYDNKLSTKNINIRLNEDAIQSDIASIDSSIYSTKDYYKTCIGLAKYNYKKRLILTINNVDEDAITSDFLTENSLGTFSGVEIENVYLKKTEEDDTISLAYPIFFNGVAGKNSKLYTDLDNSETTAKYLKADANLKYNVSKYLLLKETFADGIEEAYRDFYTSFVTNNYEEQIITAYMKLADETIIEVKLNFYVG